MDRLLKLKLEMAYKDFPVELARPLFEQLKNAPPPTKSTIAKIVARPKIKIPA
jgi:hypothetical protein